MDEPPSPGRCPHGKSYRPCRRKEEVPFLRPLRSTGPPVANCWRDVREGQNRSVDRRSWPARCNRSLSRRMFLPKGKVPRKVLRSDEFLPEIRLAPLERLQAILFGADNIESSILPAARPPRPADGPAPWSGNCRSGPCRALRRRQNRWHRGPSPERGGQTAAFSGPGQTPAWIV